MQGSGRKKSQKNGTSFIIKFSLMVYFRGQADTAQSPMHGSIGVGECCGYHFLSPEMGQVLWWHSGQRRHSALGWNFCPWGWSRMVTAQGGGGQGGGEC